MTDGIQAPDAFEVALECRAWRQAPRIIGGPSHHHVCRQPTEHEGPHVCGCGETFTRRRTP